MRVRGTETGVIRLVQKAYTDDRRGAVWSPVVQETSVIASMLQSYTIFPTHLFYSKQTVRLKIKLNRATNKLITETKLIGTET